MQKSHFYRKIYSHKLENNCSLASTSEQLKSHKSYESQKYIIRIKMPKVASRIRNGRKKAMYAPKTIAILSLNVRFSFSPLLLADCSFWEVYHLNPSTFIFDIVLPSSMICFFFFFSLLFIIIPIAYLNQACHCANGKQPYAQARFLEAPAHLPCKFPCNSGNVC